MPVLVVNLAARVKSKFIQNLQELSCDSLEEFESWSSLKAVIYSITFVA